MEMIDDEDNRINSLNVPPETMIAYRKDLIVNHAHVLVQSYHHRVHGRVRRAFLKEFNEQERDAIYRLYTRCYKWSMVTGYPEYISMKHGTYHLLIRAAQFFATIWQQGENYGYPRK